MKHQPVTGVEPRLRFKVKSKRFPLDHARTPLRNGSQLLCGALISLAACLQTGCGPKPEEPTSEKRTTSQSPSPLRAALERPDHLALELDPARRPLILSKPAESGREWALQALLDGYSATENTNTLWDAQVLRAYEAYADYTRVNTTLWPELKQALAEVVTTGCDDPMIHYMRVRYRQERLSAEESALGFLEAHEAMMRSRHHPAFKFLAGARAVEAARSTDRDAPRETRIIWTTVCLEDLARDTNAPVDEVFNAATHWLNRSTSKAWIDYVTTDLEPILELNWGHTERWFRFHGDAEVWRAWGTRGSGFGDTVKPEGWEGFARHLKAAEGSLTKAWQMNSNSATTAYLMMQVELGQGRGRSRMETWFNRAMSLNTNYYDAAKLMSFYLEPRWYGSEADALAFARKCVESDKWGGTVPLVLAEVHRSLATFFQQSESPGYWQRARIWRDLKASYERFFELNPDGTSWRHNYARDAYACGQYSVFLDQAKQFTYGTNHAFFGGEAKFNEMLARADSTPDVSLR